MSELHQNEYNALQWTIGKFVSEDSVDGDKRLINAYGESPEHIMRDETITGILEQYYINYKNKVKSNKIFKWILFVGCLLFVAALVSTVIAGVWMNFSNGNCRRTSDVQFITVCVSFAGSIIGILTIIAKYTFPEKEEEHITKIVRSIQDNDLSNKRENKSNNGEK